MEYTMHCECYIDINTEEIVKCDLCEASLDMYGALKEVLYYLDHKDGDTLERWRALDLIITSLAKAEGKL